MNRVQSVRPRRGATLPACALATFGMLLAAGAVAQEPTPTPPPTPAPEEEEERSTGLPKKGTWTFNLDVGLGGFGFRTPSTPTSGPIPRAT